MWKECNFITDKCDIITDPLPLSFYHHLSCPIILCEVRPNQGYTVHYKMVNAMCIFLYSYSQQNKTQQNPTHFVGHIANVIISLILSD